MAAFDSCSRLYHTNSGERGAYEVGEQIEWASRSELGIQTILSLIKSRDFY